MKLSAYLAPEGFVNELISEIDQLEGVFDHLVLAIDQHVKPLWVQNIWLDPVFIPIQSISVGAKQLRALQLRWSPYEFHLHRRTQLIQQQLTSIKSKPLDFLQPLPTKNMGSWTLIDEQTILASPHCSSPLANGIIQFNENKQDPPSRAYLKLWELFTLFGIKPKPDELCLDLGSSPGGWTWVLQQIGCSVISVDKAPLAPIIAKLPNINFLECSAFAITPKEIGKIDWFFSDIICYPQRLFKLVQSWLESGLCDNFVCTLKLQGNTDSEIVKQFAEIPGSRLMHLFHNKHELTWIKS